jgi:hypothetical protein
MRWLPLILLCNCGLIFDGAYLLSDKHTTKVDEQRRPTGEVQTNAELSLRYEGARLKVSCEEVTHSVDRVWNVEKVYEYQGGFYQAHLVPVILEGVIGSALAIGLGAKCGTDFSCDTLYATIPFGVDFTYSLIRLLTIDPPKLVDKHVNQVHVENRGTVIQRANQTCAPGTMVAVLNGSAREYVDEGGYLSVQGQQRIESAMLDVNAVAAVISGDQRSADINRCAFFLLQPNAVPPSGCSR